VSLRVKITARWLIGIGIASTFLGVGLAAIGHEIVVQYPLDTWRMDLDDFLANVGLFLGGLGALFAVLRRQDEHAEKINEVEDRMNGGMADLAARILQEQIEIGGYDQAFLQLLDRVLKLEEERRTCNDQLTKLRQWLADHLGVDVLGEAIEPPEERET
jgi:hypothetical protein